MVGGRPWAEGNQIAVCTRLEQALSIGIDVAFLGFLFLWCSVVPKLIFLYLSALNRVRFGLAASSPKRFFLSASYSW